MSLIWPHVSFAVTGTAGGPASTRALLTWVPEVKPTPSAATRPRATSRFRVRSAAGAAARGAVEAAPLSPGIADSIRREERMEALSLRLSLRNDNGRRDRFAFG